MGALIPRIRVLGCPNCGGAVELRGHSHTVHAICSHCNSVLDARTPELQLVERAAAQEHIAPLIPLGTRGTFEGTQWEAIGFQVRQIEVEGVAYRWSEYLLYNPFRGYRYVTEYHGHWNFVRPVRAVPYTARKRGKKAVKLEGRTYAHFQNAQAETVYVTGEFPWQARSGDTVTVDDYVAPPHVLSSETNADEVTWSSGIYMAGADVWRAFGLAGAAPKAQGVYANQPSPHMGRLKPIWKTFGLLAVVFLLFAAVGSLAGRGRQAFRSDYRFDSLANGEPAFVTPVFELNRGNALIEISTDLNNDWAFFGMALINEGTGQAYDFGQEVSYYYGRDSDGDWSEGSRTGRKTVGSVTAGRYYLRIEPDMDEGTHSVNYTVTVKSRVIDGTWLLLAFVLLPLPALWVSWRAIRFESRRWAESDYAPGGDD